MKGFLARWVEQGADSEARHDRGEREATVGVQATPEVATAAPPSPDIRSAEPSTRATPWAEWKAAQLNQVFEQQGVTGRPGRITADTVRRSSNHETANAAKQSTKETIQTAPPVSGEDMTLREARHETANLLATAYRRHAVAKQVGTDPRKASGDDGLAKSCESSVHGVVP
jgi:pyruvate/2-oxoglutarate dehydrogenase complex dihydrolipoamide acyltransferase (E2) component